MKVAACIALLSGWLAILPATGEASPDSTAIVALQQHAMCLLASRFPSESGKFSVRIVRTSTGLDTLKSPDVRFPSLKDMPAGHQQIDVYAGPEASRKAGWALLFVSRFDSVAVLKSAVRPGEAVGEAQVEPVWTETTRMLSRVMRWSEVQAMLRERPVLAARALDAGAIVRRGDLKLPDDVAPGEAVTLRYERSGLVIQLPCTARESGRTGETIRVYSSSTRTSYRARIVRPGHADWVSTL